MTLMVIFKGIRLDLLFEDTNREKGQIMKKLLHPLSNGIQY